MVAVTLPPARTCGEDVIYHLGRSLVVQPNSGVRLITDGNVTWYIAEEILW